MLSMHLLQSTLVLMNTLLVQNVLAEPEWAGRLTDADRRGLTPLFWSNINPDGTFFLDIAQPARARTPAHIQRASRRRIARYFAPGDSYPRRGPSRATSLGAVS
jgi:Tn3 transposase DDE domain